MQRSAYSFLFVALFASLAGCPNGDSGVPLVCNQACIAGFVCDGATGTCVPGGDGPEASVPIDMAMVQADCTPACGGQTPHCSPQHKCVPCLTDDHCPGGFVCKSNLCVQGCADDARCRVGGMPMTMACCGGQCVDTAIDPSNCGKCAMTCMGGNASSTCSGGACAFGACNPGWGDCNANPADGCEANLHLDIANCSKCGMACKIDHATAGCADACYIKSCDFGYDDCDGDITNGCELPVLSDPKNCGACGNACAGAPHAKASCVNAACLITMCDLGYTDCNGDPADGCETQTGTDAKNCGRCGNVCGGNLVCVNGGCTCPNCNIPNAKSKCVNNMCAFDSCVAGFADCNNNTGDGCEVDLNNDAKNCSACGMACPQNAPYCGNGMCGQGQDFGPVHTFTGLTSTHYITQGGCSAGGGNIDTDAAYFCLHFYGQPLGKVCKPVPGYKLANTPNCGDAKMHKNGGCTGNGNNIPNTMCDNGACKIGNWQECTSGLTNLICHCM